MQKLVIEKDKYQLKKLFDNQWRKWPKPMRYLILIMVIIGGSSLPFISIFGIPNINIHSQTLSNNINTPITISNNNILSPSLVSIEYKNDNTKDDQIDNCFTGNDFIPIVKDEWQGLVNGFDEVNGVYSPSETARKVDSVAFFNKPCKGSVKIDVEFIPYSKTLINLNMYYGNWFRWEIGGNDLNSARLYKNLEGCTAFKHVMPIKFHPDLSPVNEYFKEHIRVGKKVTASMLVFLARDGKLRTKLDLQFTSRETGQVINVVNFYYYDFDVANKCDDDTVLDISKDSENIGIGLMRSDKKDYPYAEVPRVRLEGVRISEYKEE